MLKEQSQQNTNVIQNKSINELLFTGNQFNYSCCLLVISLVTHGFTLANATLISFFQQILCLFFVFISNIPKKGYSQRYVVTNGKKISRAFLVRALCWSSRISSRYSLLTSADATPNVYGWIWLSSVEVRALPIGWDRNDDKSCHAAINFQYRLSK